MEEYVTRNYIMDPETEDMIHGTELRNGMYVLIADLHRRELRTSENQELLDKYNRWCYVSDLRFYTNYNQEYLSFIGVYPRGEKIQHRLDAQVAWLVNKDSMPPKDNSAVLPEHICGDGCPHIENTL